jgi:hypothetical protein
MKTLNVIKTTREELSEKWQIPLPTAYRNPLYARANAKGEVNWEKTAIYTQKEIDLRDKVVIKNG